MFRLIRHASILLWTSVLPIIYFMFPYRGYIMAFHFPSNIPLKIHNLFWYHKNDFQSCSSILFKEKQRIKYLLLNNSLSSKGSQESPHVSGEAAELWSSRRLPCEIRVQSGGNATSHLLLEEGQRDHPIQQREDEVLSHPCLNFLCLHPLLPWKVCAGCRCCCWETAPFTHRKKHWKTHLSDCAFLQTLCNLCNSSNSWQLYKPCFLVGALWLFPWFRLFPASESGDRACDLPEFDKEWISLSNTPWCGTSVISAPYSL